MTAHRWDQLSDKFGVDIEDDVIPADAADNILIAWPPIVEFVEEHVRPASRVIDFGCGGGRFVREMNRRGYEAIGVDPSLKMIESARRAFGSESFYVGDAHDIASLGSVDAITSVMALQFVEEIEMRASSSGQCNDGQIVAIDCGVVADVASWHVVDAVRDDVEICLGVNRQVTALRQPPADQSVEVLVRRSLPRTVGIAEKVSMPVYSDISA